MTTTTTTSRSRSPVPVLDGGSNGGIGATAVAAASGGSAKSSAPQQPQQPAPLPPPSPQHTWEGASGNQLWEHAVREDAQGRIVLAASDSLAETIRKRRKRMEQSDYAMKNQRVVRDMIRYMYLMIDASRWVRQKDPVLPPGTRLDVMVSIVLDFVQEYYDQNPLSQLGLIMVRNGEAEILTHLSSSSKTHQLALQSMAEMVAMEGPAMGGEFSLQNGLEVAGRSLGHQPRHGSREIVAITAALSTCDPGYILTETMPRLQQAKIRVSCFALAAELHVCRKIAEETGGTTGVCLDKAHFRDWMRGQCVPPPSRMDQNDHEHTCEMILMGFPTRTSSETAEIVHATREKTILTRTAYTCPQCQARNAELPTDCAVCGLKLVLAPHLARSFHHLFPVPPFVEKPMLDARQMNTVASENRTSSVQVVSSTGRVPSSSSRVDSSLAMDSRLVVTSRDDEGCCFSCLRPFSDSNDASQNEDPLSKEELLRFECPDCKNLFCIDCDAYLHETLHNCPGCLR